MSYNNNSIPTWKWNRNTSNNNVSFCATKNNISWKQSNNWSNTWNQNISSWGTNNDKKSSCRRVRKDHKKRSRSF